jgi:hypothetical protein
MLNSQNQTIEWDLHYTHQPEESRGSGYVTMASVLIVLFIAASVFSPGMGWTTCLSVLGLAGCVAWRFLGKGVRL